jgi:hypothetical protein
VSILKRSNNFLKRNGNRLAGSHGQAVDKRTKGFHIISFKKGSRYYPSIIFAEASASHLATRTITPKIWFRQQAIYMIRLCTKYASSPNLMG